MRWLRFIGASFLVISICTGCTFNIPKLEERHNQAIAFAKDSLEKIGQNWDATVFIQRADPRLKEAGDPTPVFKQFANILGPIKKIDTVESTGNESLSIAFNRPDYSVALKCDITCQSGPAIVNLGVNHRNDQWFLSAFYVDSKLLQKMNEKDRCASKQYVMRIAPLICSNLDVDYIKQYSDPKMIEELKTPVEITAAKGVFFAISRGLGQFKNCTNFSSGRCSLFQGQYVYIYTAAGEFERGKATLTMTVIKDSGEWKLRGFDIKAHS